MGAHVTEKCILLLNCKLQTPHLPPYWQPQMMPRSVQMMPQWLLLCWWPKLPHWAAAQPPLLTPQLSPWLQLHTASTTTAVPLIKYYCNSTYHFVMLAL